MPGSAPLWRQGALWAPRVPLAIGGLGRAPNGSRRRGSAIVGLGAGGRRTCAATDRGSTPAATWCCRASINTHHHFYQTLTRAYGPALDKELFDWLEGAVLHLGRADAGCDPPVVAPGDGGTAVVGLHRRSTIIMSFPTA